MGWLPRLLPPNGKEVIRKNMYSIAQILCMYYVVWYFGLTEIVVNIRSTFTYVRDLMPLARSDTCDQSISL